MPKNIEKLNAPSYRTFSNESSIHVKTKKTICNDWFQAIDFRSFWILMHTRVVEDSNGLATDKHSTIAR